jgi:hypothetical protein
VFILILRIGGYNGQTCRDECRDDSIFCPFHFYHGGGPFTLLRKQHKNARSISNTNPLSLSSPATHKLFSILLLWTLGFSGLVSEEWASPVLYYNNPTNTHLSPVRISTKSRLSLTLLPLCPQHMLGPWQRAAHATEAPFELVSTATPHHGGAAAIANRTSTAYRSTGADANGMDCPCLATPRNAALIIASYTRVGAYRSVAPYDNGTASEHNAVATPPGVGRVWQNHLKNKGFVSQDYIGGFSTKRECANTHK